MRRRLAGLIGLGSLFLLSACTSHADHRGSAPASATTSPTITATPRPPSSAGTPPLSSSDAAIQAAQLPYFDLNGAVYDAMRAAHALPQLTGTALDVPHHRLDVYIAGDPPGTLDPVRIRAASEGIDLAVHRAAHTKGALEAAAQEVSQLSGIPTGYSIEIATDGSGITLRYPGDGSLPSSTKHAIAQIAATTGVPIAVHNHGPIVAPA